MAFFHRGNIFLPTLSGLLALLLTSCEWRDSSIRPVNPGPSKPPMRPLPRPRKTPFVDPTALTITNLSQTWGTRGMSFVIEGANFDEIASNNIVKLGSNGLAVHSATKTRLIVSIPKEKPCEFGTFEVTVSVGGKTATFSEAFTLSSLFGIGYTDKMSYSSGETLTAYLSADANYPINSIGIYDLNHNLVFSVNATVMPQLINATAPFAEGFGLTPTVDIAIPADLKSGVYLIENEFPFVVRSATPCDVTIVFPTNTENAYCDTGGKSLYSAVDRPQWVSFLRPIPFPGVTPTLNFSERGLQWFMTQTDYSVNYVCDMDLETDRYIKDSKLLILVGHNEYWTRPARQVFDRFVDHGGNALILSGNMMWWQVRYSADRTKLICYKDKDTDPETNPLLKTINWIEPSLQYPVSLSIGADYEHGGYGNRTDKGWDGYKIVTPNSPLLQGTGLVKGSIFHLPTVEFDGAFIQGVDSDGYPKLDYSYYNFYKMELIGFDKGVAKNGSETTGTFIAFQRTPTSGKIVHTGSTNWCSYEGIGGSDGHIIRLITKNAITKMIHNENIFSK